MFRRLVLFVLSLMIPALALAAPDRAPDLVLSGQIARADHQTYRLETFQVPDGVRRLTVAFGYTGRDQKTVIDLGVRDPQRFRGWSGGSKSEFTLATEDATPGYLPGPIPAGRWTLTMGVPNIRPDATARYEAKVYFERAAPPQGFSAPLRDKAGWYRGDLHMHTGHSDGSCAGQGDVRAPCPVYRTVEAAVAAGLDFIAITDHNTTSQYEAMRELQPTFDALLLVPGREITTFQGHANVFGPTGDIDFRLTGKTVPRLGALLDGVEAQGGLVSINHPSSPSGEACMGCGWTAPDTDFRRIQAIEVANGGSQRAQGGAEGPLSGVDFWQARLNAGDHITAIGGSDNHDAGLAHDTPSAIGRPTTVVHAAALSTPAILDGLKSGRVFIDLDGTRDRMLDLSAEAARGKAVMGETLSVSSGETIALLATVAGVPLTGLEVVRDGAVVKPAIDAEGRFQLVAGPRSGWVRLNVRDAGGRLLLIGNPVYLRVG